MSDTKKSTGARVRLRREQRRRMHAVIEALSKRDPAALERWLRKGEQIRQDHLRSKRR